MNRLIGLVIIIVVVIMMFMVNSKIEEIMKDIRLIKEKLGVIDHKEQEEIRNNNMKNEDIEKELEGYEEFNDDEKK